MNISREEKKVEAIARMKKWGIFSQTIKQFEKEDLVSISEPLIGAFYWVEGEELERMKQFEEQHNALVYCIVRAFTEFGKLDAYLFVSDYKEEWQMDHEDQKAWQQLAYVVNWDAPDCSEFGSIGLQRTVAAGLKRIW